MLNKLCWCNSKLSYQECCFKLHVSNYRIGNPEQLMRSRYSAFVLKLRQYLIDTWHISTRDTDLCFDEKIKWLGLDIIDFKYIDSMNAYVEFIAKGKQNGRAFRIHEKSFFVLENGYWYYINGEIK